MPTTDLRRPIAHDPDMPFVVVDADTDVLHARFADEDHALNYAVSVVKGVVKDTTPPTPPAKPGWYMSGHTDRPYKLDAAGRWWGFQKATGEWGPVDVLEARANMPLNPWDSRA